MITDYLTGACRRRDVACVSGSIYMHVCNWVNQSGAFALNNLSFGETHNPFVLRSGGANLEWVEYSLYLDAGTYTIKIMTLNSVQSGIMDVDVAAVEVGSFDLYNNPTVVNQVNTIAGVVVAVAGITSLVMRADGKNGASTGFYLYIQDIQIYRTA